MCTLPSGHVSPLLWGGTVSLELQEAGPLEKEQNLSGNWVKMRAVVQRVLRAGVKIDGLTTAFIGTGLVVFLGIQKDDSLTDIVWLAEKIVHLRIFPDGAGKMNRSLADINGEMLIVSQFTLYADCRKGRRPGFSMAAPPEIAEPLYDQFVSEIQERGIRLATGTFQADMAIELINDGPVTMILDSEKTFST